MRLKQFTKEQKLKYIHIYQKEGFEIAIITLNQDKKIRHIPKRK
ncbi:Uncharacterised protein [Mycoplasmopsis gallopavonis]|uniref:Uncharacterized protein n=1 Tax=Mycoplasmopsis gallopavonis TaxID=76629 RepID=A0A449AYR0_9BACT|nr:hypothetical protein [Mycoplasmopsis gallopavonis]VEU72640.1 Uncharacterised protein [Mycoplasmopsis gallopavonis]